MVLIILRFTLFFINIAILFSIKIHYKAEKCFYIHVLSSSISTRVGMPNTVKPHCGNFFMFVKELSCLDSARVIIWNSNGAKCYDMSRIKAAQFFLICLLKYNLTLPTHHSKYLPEHARILKLNYMVPIHHIFSSYLGDPVPVLTAGDPGLGPVKIQRPHQEPAELHHTIAQHGALGPTTDLINERH